MTVFHQAICLRNLVLLNSILAPHTLKLKAELNTIEYPICLYKAYLELNTVEFRLAC